MLDDLYGVTLSFPPGQGQDAHYVPVCYKCNPRPEENFIGVMSGLPSSGVVFGD